MTRSRLPRVPRLPRLLRLPGLLLALVLGALLTAAPAQAWPDPDVGTPGVNHITVDCVPGRLYISPFMSVDNAYFGGQYVSWRYHLTNSHGYRGTSGWSGSRLLPYTTTNALTGVRLNYGLTMHSQASIPAARGAIWDIKVQVARWVPGVGYRYSAWLPPSMVTNATGRFYAAPWATCTT